MNQSTFTNKQQLECLILGHYDLGFDFHENLQRSRGLTSGEYRNLRMDFITLDGQKMPYLNVLNHLSDQRLHWTEMTQVAPVYLASFLSGLGIDADFSSFFYSQRDELNELLSRRPKVVALTTTLYLTPLVAKEVVKFVREKSPDSFIVVGGPLIDNLAYHLEEADFRIILEDIGSDAYVQQKQGEQTLANMLLRLRESNDLSKVRNCYIKWNGQFVFTGAEAEFSLAPINWDNYTTKNLGSTLQTRTALSCPFRCTFCDYPVRAGKWVPQEITSVEHELRQIQERSNVRNLVFIDDTFNVPADRFKEILRMMIRNQFTFRWYSYLRCNIMDEELCDLMARSNCGGVFLGIESGDPDVLKIMKKVATPEQYLRGMKLLNASGIMTFASLIVGFPGETERSVENTIQLLQDAGPTFFRGEIWYNNPRAPIYSKSKDVHNINGFGYKWRHNTMDWEQGCEMVLKLFKTVSNSTWLPMYDFDFWILPYLEGKGLTVDQIKNFVGACGDLLSMEIGLPRGGKIVTDRAQAENNLRQICADIQSSSFPAAAVAYSS
ncbi:MAG: radical SAM protein [Acidobacteria bacterium]|nr:radical SAM protein [Acidobacteriota bacterium]